LEVLKARAIVLFSGGLDSILAALLLREQDVDVEALSFETPFFSARKARASARAAGLPLSVLDITVPHLEMLRHPRYGYGRNMNPCIDCHTLMLSIAGRRMEETGADLLATGEVLGQRPMSQGKQSLHIVAKNSGYQDYIVRPLSARLLPETLPEREGKVDRERLGALQGRGRKEQLEMARRYGVRDYPAPAGGCLLTDPMFSRRLRDLFGHATDVRLRDIELLKHGRHFRISAGAKVIVGRRREDNEQLARWAEDGDAVLQAAPYPGPFTLIPYGGDEEARRTAAGLCARYSDAPKDAVVPVNCTVGAHTVVIHVNLALAVQAEARLI
jgi:tRNA-uridine 2-sulfurtransferase